MKAKAQLLSAALFDDAPELTLQQGAVTAAWFNRAQKPFRNAWALCGAAHFHNLNASDKKVAELCLQHFDQDLGLRSPNMQELLAADRKIWNLISEGGNGVFERECEQPRKKGKGKGGKAPGKTTQPPTTKPDDWPDNRLTELRRKQICRCYTAVASARTLTVNSCVSAPSKVAAKGARRASTVRPTPATVQPFRVWQRSWTVRFPQTLPLRLCQSLRPWIT